MIYLADESLRQTIGVHDVCSGKSVDKVTRQEQKELSEPLQRNFGCSCERCTVDNHVKVPIAVLRVTKDLRRWNKQTVVDSDGI